MLLDDLSCSRSLAKRSSEGGVARWGLGGRTLADDGRPPAVVVVAAVLRGVKDAASGFRADGLVPVAGAAG